VSEPQGKFLVIRGGAIGDFILTLPVLVAIKEMFPGSHVEVLGYPNVTQLAVEGGAADAARSIEARALASYFIGKGEPDPSLKDYFASFHIVISYLYDPDCFFRANVMGCGEIQFVQGPHRPDEDESVHATDALLKPLEQLAIFGADPVPRLDMPLVTPSDKDGPVAGGQVAQVAVHPGSGSEQKNWPIEKWHELLTRLDERTIGPILIIGGEADSARLKHLRSSLDSPRFVFLEHRPLTEVARRLKECRMFVGHDSGIGHLAAAIGVPGITLWGKTNETVWRPRSETFQVVKDPAGLSALSVDEVVASVSKLLQAD
jgi:heptosyltransferase III